MLGLTRNLFEGDNPQGVLVMPGLGIETFDKYQLWDLCVSHADNLGIKLKLQFQFDRSTLLYEAQVTIYLPSCGTDSSQLREDFILPISLLGEELRKYWGCYQQDSDSRARSLAVESVNPEYARYAVLLRLLGELINVWETKKALEEKESTKPLTWES